MQFELTKYTNLNFFFLKLILKGSELAVSNVKQEVSPKPKILILGRDRGVFPKFCLRKKKKKKERKFLVYLQFKIVAMYAKKLFNVK